MYSATERRCSVARTAARGRLPAAAACMAGLLAAASAEAAAQFLFSRQDDRVRSFFTIDFGKYGSSEGEVSDTRFLLQLDAQAQSARFLKYNQHIDPLILPGGYSTGDITVRVVPGTSHGTFDPDRGEFNTQEDYEIHFTGDLSDFGLQSPVVLPSASRGSVTFQPDGTGTVRMVWEGQGELRNPFDPDNPIRFTYQCVVESIHAEVPRGDLNCDGAVDALDVDPFLTALFDPRAYDEQYLVCDAEMGDFNQSGRLEALDIEAFIDALYGG